VPSHKEFTHKTLWAQGACTMKTCYTTARRANNAVSLLAITSMLRSPHQRSDFSHMSFHNSSPCFKEPCAINNIANISQRFLYVYISLSRHTHTRARPIARACEGRSRGTQQALKTGTHAHFVPQHRQHTQVWQRRFLHSRLPCVRLFQIVEP
jgi:hypothetical protein